MDPYNEWIRACCAALVFLPELYIFAKHRLFIVISPIHKQNQLRVDSPSWYEENAPHYILQAIALKMARV